MFNHTRHQRTYGLYEGHAKPLAKSGGSYQVAPSLGIILLSTVGEVLLGLAQYRLQLESLDLLGVRFDSFLIDDPAIGFLFTFMPNLTTEHLISLMICYVLFVGNPVFCFMVYMAPRILSASNFATEVGQVISGALFVFALIVDVISIFFRSMSDPNGLIQKSTIEVILAAGMGFLVAGACVACAYFTALVQIRRVEAKRQRRQLS